MSLYKFNAFITRELYYSDASNYGIYAIITDTNLPHSDDMSKLLDTKMRYSTTIVGNMQRLAVENEYKIDAELVENKKYGWQYKVRNASKDIPKTTNEVRNYLLSILTETQTDVLLSHYPNIVDNIIQNTAWVPDFNLLKGIKEKTFEKIKEKIVDTYALSDILALLSPLGVSFTMIKNIASKETNPTLLKKKLMENPYQLIGRVRGLTFAKVDKFALNLNPALRLSTQRIMACVIYILMKESEDNGSTVIPFTVLNKKVETLLGRNEIYDSYRNFVAEEKINPKVLYIVGDKVGLYAHYQMEKYIWDKLNAINDTPSRQFDGIDERINQIESTLGYIPSDEQLGAVKSISDHNVVVISGKAGCGKTTTLKAILNVYNDCKINIVAFSAKAARRTEEVTNYPAQTIHRYLLYDGLNFQYNEANQTDTSILIIDEMSMVNTSLFYHLMKAIPNDCKVIMIGDHKQLPPIGAGNIFVDLMKLKNPFVNIQLTKVFRQAQESGITSDANSIRESHLPFEIKEPTHVSGVKKDMIYLFKEEKDVITDTLINLYMGYLDKGYTIDDISIILPRKSNCTLCTNNINKIILDKLIKETSTNTVTYGDKVFRIGAKVINTVNDYRKEILNSKNLGVLNGETGKVVRIYKDGSDIITTVDFGDKLVEFSRSELANLELAYALTIHKIQGSEIPIGIIGIEKSHYIMLNNNLIYTALTRASEKCIMVAQPTVFSMGVKNTLAENRTTFWQCSNIMKG